MVFKLQKKLKYKNFYFSGGVAQNIKEVFYLSKNKKINKIFVPPAAGDTTISIGACFYGAVHFSKIVKKIHPISSMYLGSKLENKSIQDLIIKKKQKKFIIKNKFKAKDIAIELKNGSIIGRCA